MSSYSCSKCFYKGVIFCKIFFNVSSDLKSQYVELKLGINYEIAQSDALRNLCCLKFWYLH